MQLMGYLFQQKYFTVLGVFTEPCFFSTYTDRNWPFMKLFIHVSSLFLQQLKLLFTGG